jgi:hypothetical protein
MGLRRVMVEVVGLMVGGRNNPVNVSHALPVRPFPAL